MRRTFRRKVWTSAILGGLAVCAMVLFASVLQRILAASSELDEKNRETVARIHCEATPTAWVESAGPPSKPACDLTGIEFDLAFDSADYVLDRRTRFFIYNRSPYAGFWFDKSDVSFLRRFRTPTSITFETGDRWRLYSKPAQGGLTEVMVAAFQSAPWVIGESAVGSDVDEQLQKEADEIIVQLRARRISTRVDAWQIVDASTGSVRQWSPDVPALYPEVINPSAMSLFLHAGELWLARGFRNDAFQALSVQSLGSPYAYVLVSLIAFAFGAAVAYPVAKRLVKPGVTKPVSLQDALRSGENDVVEFKQEIKERQRLLAAVTAFANTNGGTIFIGVADKTREVIGVDVTSLERRDLFERSLRDAIRSNIQPAPSVTVDYPIDSGHVVVRILVLASRELHSFEGRYYVREGAQNRYVSDGEIAEL